MRCSIIAIVLALSACGQPSTPAATPAPAAPSTTVESLPTDVIASRIALLPAPYRLGDYEKGKRLFAQCHACHTIGAREPNRVGPHLHGILGRTAGSVADFRNYSTALKESGIVWDAATLDRWVTNPRDVVAASNMIYPGLRKEEDRRDLIAYIAVDSTD